MSSCCILRVRNVVTDTMTIIMDVTSPSPQLSAVGQLERSYLPLVLISLAEKSSNMTTSPLYFAPRFAFPALLLCFSMLTFKEVVGGESYTNVECGRGIHYSCIIMHVILLLAAALLSSVLIYSQILQWAHWISEPSFPSPPYILCFTIDNALFLHAVIIDKFQTMECLNKSNIDITSPIVLESTVEGNEFICPNKPPLYTFRCTLFNDDLIWLFNNTRVTAFLNDDQVGRIFSIHYPDSDPIYNITAVLTQVKTVSRYNTTYCVSVMTVEAYDERVVDIRPFTVSCQTFCKDENTTLACQTRHYSVAGMLMCSTRSSLGAQSNFYYCNSYSKARTPFQYPHCDMSSSCTHVHTHIPHTPHTHTHT